jgi:hypothetical protein
MPVWCRRLRVGTRGSPMALRQTALVRDRLGAAHPELAAKGAVEIVPIRTTGDRVQHRLLAEIGGKGLFVKEIEEALIAGSASRRCGGCACVHRQCAEGSGCAPDPPPAQDDPEGVRTTVRVFSLHRKELGARSPLPRRFRSGAPHPDR